jgi:hypothetical protein
MRKISGRCNAAWQMPPVILAGMNASCRTAASVAPFFKIKGLKPLCY